MTNANVLEKSAGSEAKGFAYCPICTHTVETAVVLVRRGSVVKPGEKCPRCGSPLDVAVVRRVDRAA
jgi:hypothetical protein